MSAETKILVRVLKTQEAVLEINAVTLLQAEVIARVTPGVVAVLDSCYADDSHKPMWCPNHALPTDV